MKPHHQFIHLLKDQRGVSAVIVAIMLTVLIGFAAVAVDIGYLYATRNQLQNVADAAALAATGQLGQVYMGMAVGDHGTYEYDPEGTAAEQQIVGVAIEVGLKNQAASKNVVILENEVQVGQWLGDSNPDGFYLTNEQPDAVRVITRRDETVPTGRVTIFFARIFGISETAVTTQATASLTPPSDVAPGELKLPVALSENHFPCPPEGSPPVIHLSPTDSCAGWHNFFDDINASAMTAKLLGFIKSDPVEGECLEPPCGGQWFKDKFDWDDDDVADLDAAMTPGTGDGDAFEFQGGDIAALFNGGYLLWQDRVEGDETCENCDPVIDPETGDQMFDDNEKKPAPIIALFDYFRFRDDDGDDSVWTATIPIYEDDDPCNNPNTLLGIEGFTEIVVFNVTPPPDKNFDVLIDCETKVIDARGGGGLGEAKGKIPNLVE